VDPHWFNADPDTDPDTEFFYNCGSGSRCGFGSRSRSRSSSWSRVSVTKLDFFSLIVGHFCPPGSGIGSSDPN
jgi:hypothetical protein